MRANEPKKYGLIFASQSSTGSPSSFSNSNLGQCAGKSVCDKNQNTTNNTINNTINTSIQSAENRRYFPSFFPTQHSRQLEFGSTPSNLFSLRLMFERSKLESLRDVSVTRIGDTLSYGFPQTELWRWSSAIIAGY